MILDIGFTNLMNYIAFSIALIICLIIWIPVIKDYTLSSKQLTALVIVGIFALICAGFVTTNEEQQFIKTNKTAPFETIQQYIHVEKDKIVIDPLPSNYKYVKYDNIQPNSNETNIFTFEQDSTYNKNYLINYKGEKYILNEHDAQFIKNKQNELNKTP